MSEASRQTWKNIGQVALGGMGMMVQGERQRRQSRQDSQQKESAASLAHQRDMIVAQRAETLQSIKNKGAMAVATMEQGSMTERSAAENAAGIEEKKIQYGTDGNKKQYTAIQLANKFDSAKKAYFAGKESGAVLEETTFDDFARGYLQTSVYNGLVADGAFGEDVESEGSGGYGEKTGGGFDSNAFFDEHVNGGGPKTLKKTKADQQEKYQLGSSHVYL